MTAPARLTQGAAVREWTLAKGGALRDALRALRTGQVRSSAERRIAAYVDDLGQTLAALGGRPITAQAVPRTCAGRGKHPSALSVTVVDGGTGAACDVDIVLARHRLSVGNRSFAYRDMDRALEELTRVVSVALFTERLDDLRRTFKAADRPE